MDQQSKIAILGFGIEGKTMLEYLIKHGYNNVTVCDSNVDLKENMPQGVSVRLGPKYLNDLTDFNTLFRSPGIRWLMPEIQNALARGVEVSSPTAFFIDQCPAKIIGVTGTKGKGTTSTLIYEILKKAGKKVFLGGNIGVPAIGFLDDVQGENLVVLELSSFQLQDITKSPKYAVLLNTTSDHLDYHADDTEYWEAKESLLMHQGNKSIAVLNKDYEYVKHYSKLGEGKKLFVSVKNEVKDGVFIKDGDIFYSEDGKKEKILNISEVVLIGSHNLENIMPAIVIAKEIGVKNSTITEVIKGFKGLEHRLEFVAEVNGTSYYNDSFSTTPETSMAAIDSFSKPTVLIAGGSDKGLDYGEWALKILTKPNLRAVVLIGDTAEAMEEEIHEAEKKLGDAEGSPTVIMHAKSLEEAVEKGRSFLDDNFSEDKSILVMSPASASFGMFQNYKERGTIFKKIVVDFKKTQ